MPLLIEYTEFNPLLFDKISTSSPIKFSKKKFNLNNLFNFSAEINEDESQEIFFKNLSNKEENNPLSETTT